MAVVLMILKILGFLLLGILAFALLLILLVLFVPVHYSGRVKKEAESLQGAVKASWLLHFINVCYSFGKDGTGLKIRVFFFIPLKFGRKKKSDAEAEDSVTEASDDLQEKSAEETPAEGKKKAKKQKKKKASESIALSSQKEEKTSFETAVSSQKEEAVSSEVSGPSQKEEKTLSESVGKDSEQSETPSGTIVNDLNIGKSENDAEAEKEDTEERGEEKEPLIDRLIDLHAAVMEKIHGFYDKCIDIVDDVDDKVGFLTEEQVLDALKRVLASVGRILKSYLPHKGKGYIELGLESPDSTGKITGLYAATVPIHHGIYEFRPFFNEKHLDLDLTLKGHILVFILVREAVRLILSRNVRYTLRNFKKHFKKKKEA